MGKGRKPCCDKSEVKRGPWSPEEDLKLITFIQRHGYDNWRALPKQAGLLRCGKSCRLRWINYLRPDVKRGNFTKEEEDTIVNLHQTLGNKWSKIASYLPGRTDNEIKNIFNTHLKKRILALQKENCNDVIKETKESSSTITSSPSSSSITLLYPSNQKRISNEFERHQSYVNEGSAKKKPRVVLTLEDSQIKKVEDLSTISSVSSDKSIFSNLEDNDIHQVDCSQVSNMLHEMNKPKCVPSDNILELDMIPFVSDDEFWNILDGLEGPTNTQQQISTSISQNTSTQLEEEYHQNNEWFHFLENELELGENFKTDKQKESIETDQTLLSSQIYIGNKCYESHLDESILNRGLV